MKKALLYIVCAMYYCAGVGAREPLPWQMGLQPSVTPVMDRITDLHHHLLTIIIPIGILVTLVILYIVWRFSAARHPVPTRTTHHTALEVVWTLVPALILFVVAFPSVRLVYFADKTKEADLTVKIVGNQWYWHYEYPDQHIAFDSRMIADHDLPPGGRRLLEVDYPMVLPVHTNVRLLVTSSPEDVIHSWAVPSFGLKQDAVPGRLREIWVRVEKEGTYYGQCSEICGPGHAFMPIVVRVVSRADYQQWLLSAKKDFADSAAHSPLVFASR